jgi:CDP-glycerol glycerophosphotransferase
MKGFWKIGIIYLLRLVLRVFYIFPINKNRIVFTSHNGMEYSCNPKYIFEYMYKRYQYEYIWCLNDRKKLPEEYKDVHTVPGHAFKRSYPHYFFIIMTSKYIISNLGIESYFPIRKQQVVVNTWHGAQFKKDSRDANLYKKYLFSDRIIRDIRSKMISMIISPCADFTRHFSKAWNAPEDRFIRIGTPRNDLFFSNTDSQKRKVLSYFNIQGTAKLVLYAPTFRGVYYKRDTFDSDINVKALLNALKIKFKNDFVFLYRTHRYTKNYESSNEQVIQASGYPDMQELLCTVDILITDYSSSMWDFSFTCRPCFIYAPDLEKYKAEQGFYIPIEDLPFPVAETNEQLANNIIAFNSELYEQAVQQYHTDLGSYETGNAREQFCKLLFAQ